MTRAKGKAVTKATATPTNDTLISLAYQAQDALEEVAHFNVERSEEQQHHAEFALSVVTDLISVLKGEPLGRYYLKSEGAPADKGVTIDKFFMHAAGLDSANLVKVLSEDGTSMAQVTEVKVGILGNEEFVILHTGKSYPVKTAAAGK